jgi:hypothetical protein
LKGCKFYVQNRTKKASNQKRRVVPPLPFAIFDQQEEEEEEEEEEDRNRCKGCQRFLLRFFFIDFLFLRKSKS